MNALTHRIHRPTAHAQTRLGTWAVRTGGLALAGTVALSVTFAAGAPRPDGITDSWWVLGAGAAILLAAAVCTVTGLLAVVRDRDHSWLVAVATVAGLSVLLLTLQQVAEGLGWMTS